MSKRPPKKRAKTPKLSPEEQLELLQKEADTKWSTDQVEQLERDQADVRQYNQRRVVLVETIKFFRKLEKVATEAHRKQSRTDDWQHYLSCEKLPNPASAADLREFLYRWQYELGQNRRNQTSWTLAVDERSPLTQDDQLPVQTWSKVGAKNADIGDQYLAGIRHALRILALIDDSTPRDLLPEREVVTVRDEIRATMATVLDEITARVGGNIWRDMTPMDSITAEFGFTSDVVSCYLWSFRHVPLPPEYNYLVKSLQMTPLGLELAKPVSFDLRDALMRGLWTGYDHRSDLEPTFRCGCLESVPDLLASQEIEWADRQNLRTKRLAEMRTARESFEAAKRQKELEEAEMAKSSGGAAGGAKSPKGGSTTKKEAGGKGKAKKKTGGRKGGKKKGVEKPPLEIAPPAVTDETTVDIDGDFVQQEMQLYLQKMEQIGPDSLSLAGEEHVNLRRFRISGGIFSVSRFQKLPQPTELRSDFIYTTFPVNLQLSEMKFVAETSEDFIKITVKLPHFCFWWHEPVVCRWEGWEESQEFEGLRQELQDFHLNYEQIQVEKAKLLFGAPKLPKNTNKPTVISDFYINDIPSDIKLHFLIVDHILPRLPQNFKFHAELHKLFQRIQANFEHEQRLKIEERLNELLYPKFLAMQAANERTYNQMPHSHELLRIPSTGDVPEGSESVASFGRNLISPTIQTPVQSLLQELAMAQTSPNYLFPPESTIPLLVLTERKALEPAELDIDEMLQELHEAASSDDEFKAETVLKLFSSFLKLLDRLREKEQPLFVEPTESEELVLEDEAGIAQVTSRRSKSHIHPSDAELAKRLSRASSRQSSFLLALNQRRQQQQQQQGTQAATKKRRKRRKSTTLTVSEAPTDDEREVKPEDEQPTELKLIPHSAGRWSTRLVHKQEYDPDGKVVTFWVSKIGTFGFAMEKNYNFPFKKWNMRRTGKVADLTTTITLNCPGITASISITLAGYRLTFENASQSITPPTDCLTLDQLEKYLTRVNLNLFPEPDAPFYVPKMTTPKHESLELHTLKCVASFCLTHNFSHSFWNKFAPHREALFRARQLIEGRQEPDFVTVMANPLKAATVSVEESCSPLDQVLLAYHPEPANQPYNPDVYHLLKDSLEEPSRKLLLKTPPMLQWNVAQLLLKLRLLSFS